jgi:hypothetical protein
MTCISPKLLHEDGLRIFKLRAYEKASEPSKIDIKFGYLS